MVQVDTKVVKQIQVRQNLVAMVNDQLAQTFGVGFGQGFMGNIAEETFGCSRGPTYHVGDKLGYIAQVKDSQGWWLKLLNQLGMRGESEVQTHDFLFVGQFTDESGLRINVFPQYAEMMKRFSKEYEKARGEEVKVKVVEILQSIDGIYCKNNFVGGKENSY